MKRSPRADPLTIGRLAEVTGVHVETIRYYEKIGMLAKPVRSAGGHRNYAPEHVATLSFIRRGRELGFPLEAIRDLMRLNEGDVCCEKARAVTEAHRDDIRSKIADLRQLDRALSKLIDECQPTRWPDCPIMDALSSTVRRRRAGV
jgi:MerR family mercuric resistance operon transcriptional regulator